MRCSEWAYFHGVLLSCATTLAVAQTPPRPTDPVFVRAQTLVSDGNGAAGRALIDSVIKATSPTARLYPEALFWRASLASNAADAESDYKHIVVDYPLAPQAEDALLRLAQLELARGDKEGALIHLQKIPRDYPRSRSLARASYWTARVLFEKNDIPKACAANANALAQAGEAEIELRNQIQYQGQRCPLPASCRRGTHTWCQCSTRQFSHINDSVQHPNDGVHYSTEPDCRSAGSVFLRCGSDGEPSSDGENSGERHSHCQRSGPVQDNYAGSTTQRSR